MLSEILNTPITYLKGIGPEKAELLKKELGIFTFEGLLHHFPFRYVDRTSIRKIENISEDMPFIQIAGKIEKVQEQGQLKAKRLVAILKDETGQIELVWFKKVTWIKQFIKPGMEFLAFGRPQVFKNKYSIVHPELESLKDKDVSDVVRMQPIYSTTEKLKNAGLDSRGIQKLQEQLYEKVAPYLEEFFPADIVRKHQFIPRKEAFYHIHFPTDMAKQKLASYRLKFEELFFIQFRLLTMRAIRNRDIRGHIFDKVGENFNEFYNKYLPFELTDAQKRVIREIRYDMKTGKQMNRLLQGDVGSGKTVVGLMNMLIALDNGMQACMMAPTEILAAQHFQSISKLTFGMGINIKLLTGSTKGKARKLIAEELKEGGLHVLIGTHALLEDWVKFPNLGMVIIDEQHRFGVAQRARLWAKNSIPPHILVMTATPIPRTLAMTLYGDLDISIIDELPPGRKEIITKHSYESQRLNVFGFIKQQIGEGRQIYIVYPLIEESETMDYNNLMAGWEAIQRDFPQPDYRISIVHGRMKAEDKEFEMSRFKKGETQIMVSTTVIEVGVDVPNASVMIIESAERFGLSQMHQLRGRVGRGASQSYCILMTGYKISAESKTRLETMVRTNNGFEIAEVDLKLRGPGDLVGTRQSGILDLKIASLTQDHEILKAARYTASEILDNDPLMLSPENKTLATFIAEREKNKPDWSIIS